MANAQNESGRGNRRMLVSLWRRIDALYDMFFSDANKAMLRQLVIFLSIAGFAIHLVLIFLTRSLAHPPPLIAETGQNYLAAISTPFNFILFYEVLILIAALPASTTRSIANQFEIVSLIFIRDVFKDIGAASDLVTQHQLTLKALPAFFDMWGGFLMFFLAGVFQHVAQRRVRPSGTAIPSRGASRFIAQKKVVSIGLGTLLLGMAVYNLGRLALAIVSIVQTGHGSIESATTFYNDLFTVMIFTDVLILILSLVVSGQYELVFRNAAFVVSTILIRLSLTEGYPYGAPLALLAMIFGVLTLLVFNYHRRLNESRAG
ncbi:MAG: hypothetical protein ABSD72_15360 [Terracidiphilus sp.]|jgi:hypothetical protein